MAKYYFLQDVSDGQFYYTAGSTASTSDVGGTLPANFVPNGAFCCPLDAAAITAFYAARPPQEPGLVRQQFTGISVQLQSVYWQRNATANGPIWTLVGTNLPSIYY